MNIPALSHCLDFARRSGSNPMEIHVGPTTKKILAAALTSATVDTRSPLSKLFGSKPAEPKPLLFEGLPIVENEDCTEGMIALRSDEQMGNPNWLREAMLKINADKAVQTEREAAEKTPWMSVESSSTAPSEYAEDPSLANLTKRAGRLTPDAVLMKAFDGLDNVEEVIVIRVHKNGGSIDMAASMPKLFALGPLQAAMSRIMYDSED